MDDVSTSATGQVPVTQCAMPKKKPGWMRPLPPADRSAKIRWSEPMPRGGLDEHEPEVDAPLVNHSLAEMLEEAVMHGGEAADAARCRMEEEAWPKRLQQEAIKRAERSLAERHGHASRSRAGRYYPESDAERVALHRLRDRNGRGTLTAEEWQVLCSAWGGRCAYCSCDPQRPVIEHVVPICRGGRTTLENIVPSCNPCNRRKGTKSLDEFLGSDLAGFRQRHVLALAVSRAVLGGGQ
jgi:5-methylcytosine-specific restriction endonuclease McrA